MGVDLKEVKTQHTLTGILCKVVVMGGARTGTGTTASHGEAETTVIQQACMAWETTVLQQSCVALESTVLQ